MSPKRLPVAGPSVTDLEVGYVADAARNAWYENANSYISRFEEAFRRYIGVRHALALPSCTSAIHLGLLAARVGPGDEVIVPDATWIASAAPISYVGATPIFADVDRATWCVTAESISACLTPRTKAVIGVGLYGSLSPDLGELRAFLNRKNIFFLEDAAEALGSTSNGRQAGSFGDVGVFSFHGSKTLTTGEGGMLVSDRDDLVERIRFLRDHGRAPGPKTFWNAEVAWKYKMSAFQAAFGLGQVERAEELVGMKRRLFSWYKEELGREAWLSLNAELPHQRNSFWMVTAILDAALGLEKETVIRELDVRSIDSRPFFYPLSLLPAYERAADTPRARARNVVSAELGRWGLNLPSALSLTREDVHRVCSALREIAKR